MIDLSNIPVERLTEEAARAKRVDEINLVAAGLRAWADEPQADCWACANPNAACVEFDGVSFVGLGADGKVLSVYSVIKDGQLHRLRRVPLPVCAAVFLDTSTNSPPENKEAVR